MASGRADHSAWRELIAARLDRPLTRSETRTLTTHLRDCAPCRQVDHDYREQRALMRALPPHPVPRDLWPRTSAALDREVARGVGFNRRARRAAPASAAVATTLAGLGLIVVVGAMQLLPALSVAPTGVPGLATPFAVAPQPLAWVGNESADMFVYQTHVGHVCPPAAQGCSVDDGIVRTPVNLPANVHARNAALSPSGKALAFVGRDLNRDLIAVVLLPPTAAQSPDPGASQPAHNPGPNSGGTPGADETAGPDASGMPDLTPSVPPASAVAGLQVLAILENVESAGAPPAWSPSGQLLAFSAMPADGSHGPDVYVWSPDDAVAQPITTDHGSYFASWSGERIVFSRVSAKADAGEPQLVNVVIDPTTLETRTVAGSPLWLPAVNPARSRAVAWNGDLGLVGGLAVPRSGTLVMVDWTLLDPFAANNEPAPTDGPTGSPAATAQPTAIPTSATPSPSAAPVGSPSAPSDTPKARPSDLPATPGAPGATDTPAVLPDGWSVLNLSHDSTDSPIVDWQARWSLDGQVLGVWIAEVGGATWGRLTVFAVDPDSGRIATSDPLLPLTLARRGFSLGLDRVAWVAPSDDNLDGGLRVRTWGDNGVGGLQLLPDELDEVVPAF